MRFRQGGFLRLPSDEPEEIQLFSKATAKKSGSTQCKDTLWQPMYKSLYQAPQGIV
jgi:hypothetical protein